MITNPLRLLLKQGSSRFILFASTLAGLLWTAILIYGAWLISEIVISIIAGKPIQTLIIKLGLLFLIRSFFLAMFENWTSKKAISAKRNIRSTTTRNPFGLNSLSPAAISNLLTKGLNSLDIYYGRFLPQLVFSFLTPTILILVFLFLDKLTAVIAILTLPIIPFFGYLIGRYTADAVDKKWRTLSTLSGYFEDSLRGFATLKIFGRQKEQSKRILEMGERYNEETMKVLRISFLSSLALELAATISVALIAVSIGLRLVGGNIDFKNSLMILILAPEVYFPLRNAASLFHASTDGTDALNKVSELPIKKQVPKIEADKLIFAGGELAAMEKIFMVGDSGAGKSTIALDLVARYSNVAWIPQHPKLATGTIRDQFKLVNSEITDTEISAYLSAVGLDLNQLPMGLDSRLESGSELISSASGGQIRKIAIARAISKKSDYIIADEPTADLDSKSAKIVITLLKKLPVGVLIITHDYSLINSEDKVIKVGS